MSHEEFHDHGGEGEEEYEDSGGVENESLPSLEGARGVFATTDPETGEPIISSGTVGTPHKETSEEESGPGKDSPDETVAFPMEFLLQTRDGETFRGNGIMHHSRSTLNDSLRRVSTGPASKNFRKGWDAIFGNRSN
jgi:hypothetical protein